MARFQAINFLSLSIIRVASREKLNYVFKPSVRPRQSLFSLLPLRNIPDNAPHARRLSGVIAHQVRPQFYRENVSIFSPVFLFISIRIPSLQNLGFNNLPFECMPFLGSKILVGKMPDFVCVISQHPKKRFIALLDGSIDRHGGKAIHDAVIEAPITRLRPPQRRFTLLVPGNIRQNALQRDRGSVFLAYEHIALVDVSFPSIFVENHIFIGGGYVPLQQALPLSGKISAPVWMH